MDGDRVFCFSDTAPNSESTVPGHGPLFCTRVNRSVEFVKMSSFILVLPEVFYLKSGRLALVAGIGEWLGVMQVIVHVFKSW